MHKNDVKIGCHVWTIQTYKYTQHPFIRIERYVVDEKNDDGTCTIRPYDGGIVLHNVPALELYPTERHARGVLLALLEAMTAAVKLEQKLKGEDDE